MGSLSRFYFLSASTSPTAFLYQTRSLLPLCRSLPPCHQPRCRYTTERDHQMRNDNSDDDSPPVDRKNTAENCSSTQTSPNTLRRTSFLRQRGTSIPKPEATKLKRSNSKTSPKRKANTITRNEREAFGGLLARLKARQNELESKQEPHQVSESHSPLKKSELPVPSPSVDNLTGLMTVFESILKNEQALPKEPKSDTKPKEKRHGQGSTLQSEFQDGRIDGLEGIPLSELGRQGSNPSTGAEPLVSVSEAIAMIVERESRDIESELFRVIEEGKGDSGLWEACRKRIFSMIDHVGAGASSTTSSLDSHSQQLVEQSQTSVPSGPLNIPDAVPTGLVVAELYPRLLLLAFRMLSTHFPESQIISQFRAAVNEHSRTSAFLGTSQTLYEELMAFYWRSCNDLPAVVAFLRDMDNAGLYPSHRIRRLLREIVTQRDEAMKSRQKANEDFFWDAPPINRAFNELAGPGGWIDTFNSRKQQHLNSTNPAFRM